MAYTLLQTLSLIIGSVALFSFFSFLFRKERSCLVFFLIGFFYNLFSLSFFYAFLPVIWIDSLSLQYILLTLFILLGASISGLSFLFIAKLYFYTQQKKQVSTFLLPLFILSLFVLEDIVRSLLLSVLYLGEESSVGLRFILGSLGENLLFTPLSLFAYKAGIFMLTGIFSLIIFLIFSLYKKIVSKKIVFAYFAILCLCFLSLSLKKTGDFPHISIKIMSTKFHDPNPSTLTADYKERISVVSTLLAEDSSKNKEVKYDLLVLPESTFYLDSLDAFGKELSKNVDYILDNQVIMSKKGRGAFSVLYDTKNDIKEVRGKDDLMIFSEYSSYGMDFFIKLFTNDEDFAKYKEKIETKRSESYHVFSLPEKNVSFAVMVCSEATSFMPQYYFQQENPDFYVLQSNLASMHSNSFALVHYMNYTKLLAITTGKYVFASSNMAPSLVLTGKGKVLRFETIGNSLFEINMKNITQ